MKNKIIILLLAVMLASFTACGASEKTSGAEATKATGSTTKIAEDSSKDASTVPVKWKQKNTVFDYDFVEKHHWLHFGDLFVFGPNSGSDTYFSWEHSYILPLSIDDVIYKKLETTKNVKVDKLEDILTNEDIQKEMKVSLSSQVLKGDYKDITYEIANGKYVTINNINMYQFEGKLNYKFGSNKYTSDIYGYTFMYNGLPHQLTSVIRDFGDYDKVAKGKTLKEVTEDVIHTVSTEY